MKKMFIFLTVVCCSLLAYGQPCTINLNDTINVTQKGMEVRFIQNGCKLKPGPLMRELEKLDICADEIRQAKRHRTNAAIMIVCGVLTFPIGYLIMIVPMINQFKKSDAHIKAAVELYNSKIKALGVNDDGTVYVILYG